MMKKFTAFLLAILLIIGSSSIVIAQDSSSEEEVNEITRDDVVSAKPAVSKREATISMLLNSGWTLEDIDEWYTEEALLELDENALSISSSDLYTVNYENTETGEVSSKELSRQEFDYGVNRVLCEEEEHVTTELDAMSSNGILELQPVYDWMDMDSVTANDRIYFGYGGTSGGVSGVSGASIWNADDECYLKQNMGLVWMGNDEYKVQYRFEWMTDPFWTLVDHFAVVPATEMMVSDNPRETLTIKYKNGDETITDSTLGSISSKSLAQGRQVTVNWQTGLVSWADNLMGFFTYFLELNNKYDYEKFLVYAQYYHGKVSADTSATITASRTGLDVSFSITPTSEYVAENPMEVRANNIYMN